MVSTPSQRPILIAGPTGSGKSDLALSLAAELDGIVVNADALQVYDCWRILSARPTAKDEARCPHALYGMAAYDTVYSVGDWLRAVEPLLGGRRRLIIVGGTGLYLTTLTRGLADIPASPPEFRARGMALLRDHGIGYFQRYLTENDPEFMARADVNNPMRLQRAWEVQESTGTAMSVWQARPRNPMLPMEKTIPLVLDSSAEWLNARIFQRFDRMMELGALEEVRALMDVWDPILPASKALGAAEMVAYLRAEIDLDGAVSKAKIATRQFAKRQRTWFRSNMGDWARINWENESKKEVICRIINALR